ncbi:MAG: hypothetical protein AMJ55_04100 [Gammaproteobacteria bacterium SG8_15]|nr:MAG: hypothetical protein AMJ55_04100 [Gammaproteobacteria bacterium SG8_15]
MADKKLTHQDNFVYLTIALAVLLFSSALVDQFAGPAGQLIVQAVTLVTLAVAVWSIHREKSWYRTRVGFIAAIFLVAVLSVVLNKSGFHLAYLAIMLAFFSMTVWLAARQVLFTGAVDQNKILGAICIYLLMGLIWAVIYLLVGQIIPDSFNGQVTTPWYDNFPDFVYFSFVSLTTLGFGDISPAVPITRFLVYMEAIVGQFYLAILVASLVGIRVSDHKSDRA